MSSLKTCVSVTAGALDVVRRDVLVHLKQNPSAKSTAVVSIVQSLDVRKKHTQRSFVVLTEAVLDVKLLDVKSGVKSVNCV